MQSAETLGVEGSAPPKKTIRPDAGTAACSLLGLGAGPKSATSCHVMDGMCSLRMRTETVCDALKSDQGAGVSKRQSQRQNHL